MSQKLLITGEFDDAAFAERTVGKLSDLGYRSEEIGIAMDERAAASATGKLRGAAAGPLGDSSEPRQVKDAVKNGKVVIGVHPHRGDEEKVRSILHPAANLSLNPKAQLHGLDEELAESFPASDPPASTRP